MLRCEGSNPAFRRGGAVTANAVTERVGSYRSMRKRPVFVRYVPTLSVSPSDCHLSHRERQAEVLRRTMTFRKTQGILTLLHGSE